MRLISCVSFAAALFISSAGYAQQVTVAGWVQRVDPAGATITIRTLANPRTIPVAPGAVIRVNGAISRLDQLPMNSSVSIVAEKDGNGVLRATQISAQETGRQPAASAPPGAVVRGILTGIDVPSGMITVRTPAGDYPVTLGTASIYVNGARGSSRDLRRGQTVEVDRTLPTAASTDYVTETVRVLSPAGRPSGVGSRMAAPEGARSATGSRSVSPGMSGTAGAGLVDRGGPLTRARGTISTYRVAGTRSTYRTRRTRSWSRPRRTRHRTHYTRRVRRRSTNSSM